MSKKNTNVMACGCAVIMEQDGKTTTSVDQLVSAVNHMFARSDRREACRSSAVAHA